MQTPSIFLDISASNTSYTAFMIDPSARNFLHWFQPNLTPKLNRNLTVDLATGNASSATGATYINPQPRADGIAHEYVVLVYQQPPAWIVPSKYNTINPPGSLEARIGFDMADFQEVSGLKSPVGTTFFKVLNGTSEQSRALLSATHCFIDP